MIFQRTPSILSTTVDQQHLIVCVLCLGNNELVWKHCRNNCYANGTHFIALLVARSSEQLCYTASLNCIY